jgi:pimeloyl-ACP methyl ester carboxylesterase
MRLFMLAVCLLALGAAQADSGVIELQEGLAIGRVGVYGRFAVHQDPIQYQISSGEWQAPEPGDTVNTAQGETQTWEPITEGEDGWVRGNQLRGGYVHFTVEAEEERVMMLEARAHGTGYFNGRPIAGDPYNYGFMKVPVLVREGQNEVLFHATRGLLDARLSPVEGDVFAVSDDPTLPDLIVGDDEAKLAAVLVVNATEEPLEGQELTASIDGQTQATPLPVIAPLSVRKVGFELPAVEPEETGAETLTVSIEDSSLELPLRVVGPKDVQRHTFRSRIDGSVQYYAVRPAQQDGPQGFILSTHGASVEALNQANAYGDKEWAHLVAPTNRRPFGFDWEDWGRIDALEVLEHARDRFPTDPRKVWLTGHSMGGHGAMILGAQFPDKWAAVGPSAGWISFWSYTGAPEPPPNDPITQTLWQASNASRTTMVLPNLLDSMVYLLHGDADDNVPVRESRQMRDLLEELDHPDLHYHEQEGAGHWWDNDNEVPGAACVDWPPMMELFQQRQVTPPTEKRAFSFSTVSPAISDSAYWARVVSQFVPLALSTVAFEFDEEGALIGQTVNVLKLELEAELMPDLPETIVLDGDELALEQASDGTIKLERGEDGWQTVEEFDSFAKHPGRYGPLRDAYDDEFVFVYGTQGTDEENEWALNKARFDAETWWYRGNGSVDVVADVDFDPEANPERGVILFGNADTNAVYSELVDFRAPLRLAGEQFVYGSGGSGTIFEGDDIGGLFVFPRSGSEEALVAVIGGTGLEGMRSTDRLPIFLSGAHYPDVLIFRSNMLLEGLPGIVLSGFLGRDWDLPTGRVAVNPE